MTQAGLAWLSSQAGSGGRRVINAVLHDARQAAALVAPEALPAVGAGKLLARATAAVLALWKWYRHLIAGGVLQWQSTTRHSSIHVHTHAKTLTHLNHSACFISRPLTCANSTSRASPCREATTTTRRTLSGAPKPALPMTRCAQLAYPSRSRSAATLATRGQPPCHCSREDKG
jgi:hypothetical protein